METVTKNREIKTKTELMLKKESYWRRLGKDLKRNKYIYIMALPVVIYYIIFHYGPMYGVQIAFKDFSLTEGIWGSQWIGFKHFLDFFKGFYFWRLIRNTFLINIYELLLAFPAPIILALLLNELRKMWFKRIVQTISYLPHFISVVVVVGMLVDFTTQDGLINQFLILFGIEPISFLQKPEWFRTLYIGSGIWQSIGWGSIIYLAAMSNINSELYEAAKIDGANRFKQALHVTIPGIAPIIIILLILQIGSMMSVGFEKIILMYNPLTYDTADVISTYVYRKGILEANFSFSAAVGLFNAVINLTLLVLANRISAKVSETSLW
ncbi:sugar ABC transporter permease [Virgibacillus soli]|uniref:Sugar ABC transporter permease n=2 Tax=Lederbergia galactosidilytica TaxID=217031 RepID=A0A178A2C7_9BACI|nr:sugar ABC transporter permease [Virgibacillus soli]MBP1914976.1 putative aldouronate transport system permease protein [Lederbergia galactosidilytica]OAK74254.1 sugar ABC transporter permease [Lederbergia galactosidilytica]